MEELKKLFLSEGANLIGSNIMPDSNESIYGTNSKKLIILFSSTDGSTRKIANAIAGVLDTEIKSPEQIVPDDLQKYDLIGFGSGIFDGKHHVSLLALADTLPFFSGKKTFIFSTSGVTRNSLIKNNEETENKNPNFADPHTQLRERLLSKGFDIAGEFNCAGFNNNSFLKLFGGMNKGKPNEHDIKQAEKFAKKLINNKEEKQ
jgi:flavodoxin